MTYETLLDSLDYAPKMSTFAVKLVGGYVAEAETFKSNADTEDEVKEELTKQITSYIEGKQPIVRIMPEITRTDEGKYKGRARIATIPIVSAG